MSNRRKFLCLVSLLCLLFTTSPLFAEALTLPLSNRLVVGELTLTNQESIQFAVLEGSMFTVKDANEGFFYGLTPEILSEDDLSVAFKVFTITEHGPGLQALSETESFQTSKGEKVVPSKATALAELKVSEIRLSSLSTEDIESLRGELTPGSGPGWKPPTDQMANCCITCGSTTACGCAVSMSCGSCCESTCCGGGGGGGPQPDQRN